MPIDVTTDYIRIRVKDPSLFSPKSFRTVQLTKGIKSVMGKLLSPPEGKKGSMTVQTLLFDKDSYNRDEAIKWAKDHGFLGEAYSRIDIENNDKK